LSVRCNHVGAPDEVTAWEHLELDGAKVMRGETVVQAPGFPARAGVSRFQVKTFC
jgi:hypothetical protein